MRYFAFASIFYAIDGAAAVSPTLPLGVNECSYEVIASHFKTIFGDAPADRIATAMADCMKIYGQLDYQAYEANIPADIDQAIEANVPADIDKAIEANVAHDILDTGASDNVATTITIEEPVTTSPILETGIPENAVDSDWQKPKKWGGYTTPTTLDQIITADLSASAQNGPIIDVPGIIHGWNKFINKPFIPWYNKISSDGQGVTGIVDGSTASEDKYLNRVENDEEDNDHSEKNMLSARGKFADHPVKAGVDHHSGVDKGHGEKDHGHHTGDHGHNYHFTTTTTTTTPSTTTTTKATTTTCHHHHCHHSTTTTPSTTTKTKETTTECHHHHHHHHSGVDKGHGGKDYGHHSDDHCHKPHTTTTTTTTTEEATTTTRETTTACHHHHHNCHHSSTTTPNTEETTTANHHHHYPHKHWCDGFVGKKGTFCWLVDILDPLNILDENDNGDVGFFGLDEVPQLTYTQLQLLLKAVQRPLQTVLPERGPSNFKQWVSDPIKQPNTYKYKPWVAN